MFKRLLLAASLAFSAAPALTQQAVFCPTRPVGQSDNACASTAFVAAALNAPITTTGLTINPTVGTTNTGLVINQTGPNTGSATGLTTINFNTINLSEGVVVNSGGVVAALQINHTILSNASGHRWALDIEITRTVAVTMNGDQIAITSRAISSAINNGSGGLFGANPQAILLSGGQIGEVAGMECDSRVDAGATATWMFGCSSVKTSISAGTTTLEAAYEIAAVTQPWKNGILVNTGHGSGLASGASFITSDGVAESITNFVNLPNWTFSGSIFSFNNFVVTGAGIVAGGSATGSTLQLQATTNGSPSGDAITMTQGGTTHLFIKNGTVCICVSAPPNGNQALTIARGANAAAAMSAFTGTREMSFFGQDGQLLIIGLVGIGSGEQFVFQTVLGTASLPTQVVANTGLLNVAGQGWLASAGFSGNSVVVNGVATESFTSTNQGAKLQLKTTKLATATNAINFELGGDGHASIGSIIPTINTCGTGTVTASSTDSVGQATATGATTCTINFATTWQLAPQCVANDATSNNALRVSATTTVLTVVNLTAADVFNWICLARSTGVQ